jgi:hypothetical protein
LLVYNFGVYKLKLLLYNITRDRERRIKVTDEVITIAPNGQVFTFKSYISAKATLLSKYHNLIISNATELETRYNLYEQRVLIVRTLGMNKADITVVNLLKLNDPKQLAVLLWPMLIAHGRRTVNMAFNKNLPDSGGVNTLSYYCDYKPKEDEVLDLSYLKLTPQARVLVDMFVEKIAPFGKDGVPEHVFIKHLNELKEKLKTRQRPWIVFNYYRKQLIARGFIDIIKPRGRRRV